eukprot:jgi/Bigna1/85400/estExt_fgenesh1_pg.C_30435
MRLCDDAVWYMSLCFYAQGASCGRRCVIGEHLRDDGAHPLCSPRQELLDSPSTGEVAANHQTRFGRNHRANSTERMIGGAWYPVYLSSKLFGYSPDISNLRENLKVNSSHLRYSWCFLLTSLVFQATGIRAKDQERNPERLLQLKRICDMLLAGGYFRARVPILSPFDKVVGGLVWGITASNVDLDVDIIFQENSTIGERVRLSEQIVKALVSRVIETRAETRTRMRNQAEFNFEKSLTFEEDANRDGSMFLKKALNATMPVRRYKKQDGADIPTLIASAEATLLEFGERFYNSTTFGQGEKKKKKNNNDTASSSSSGTASSSNQPSSSFAKMRAKLQEQQGGGAAGDAATGAKKGGSKGKKTNADKTAAEDEKRQRRHRRGFFAQKSVGMFFVLRIFAADGERHPGRPDLGKNFSSIIRRNEDERRPGCKALRIREGQVRSLERQAQEDAHEAEKGGFKERCIAHRKELEEKLKQLKSGENDDQTRRMLEIERLYDSDLSKYNKLRGLLAKKNLQIARVTRSIDSIPTRAELLQYQRRFVELYELVSSKLVETRKYFELYNMLEEKHRYMVNEVELLNSISKSVPKLMGSATGQADLGKNFSSIIQGMRTSEDQVVKRCELEKGKCGVLSDKHKKMLMKQRKYFQAVKEFQEECHKNERLQAAVDAHEDETDNEGEGVPEDDAE